MQRDHVHKRESARGRWLPVAFYLVNVALWVLAGITAAAWDRLWLVVLALPRWRSTWPASGEAPWHGYGSRESGTGGICAKAVSR